MVELIMLKKYKKNRNIRIFEIVILILVFVLVFCVKSRIIINNKEIIPIPTASLVDVPYTVSVVEDDKNSISKLVLKDKNQKEIIIKELSQSRLDSGDKSIITSHFADFEFSPDYNFLYYTRGIWETSESVLYDIENKREVNLKISALKKGYTSDLKYFYACSNLAFGGSGIIIVKLPELKNIYLSSSSTFTCKYSQENNEILFSEVYPDKETEIVKYVFSIKSGKVSKIE